MNETKIEWVKNPDGSQGYTWNPITGCLNHTPEGLCLGGLFPCYAYKLANGRLRQKYLVNKNLAWGVESLIPSKALYGNANDPFYPRFWPERLKELPIVDDWSFAPSKRRSFVIRHLAGKPRGIFVCDMGELFGDWIPDQWIKQIMERIWSNPQHRFYLLTKQPQNLIKFSPFPDNCWVGVTATDYDMFIDACGYLGALKHEGKIKTAFVSIEPLLSWDSTDTGGFILSWLMMGDIDLVIIGAQTKPYKPPKIEWVEEIVMACDKAGVPVFIKDNLLAELPMSIKAKPLAQGCYKLRQELPSG